MVLIQGAQVGRALWDDEFAWLAKEHRVVRYDVRGFGDSGPESPGFQHHADLLVLLDRLGIERAHLVGLSLGGRIAVDFCLEHPERVRSLALIGPGLSGWHWSDDGGWEDIDAAVAAGDAELAARRWLEHAYLRPAMERRDAAPRLRSLVLENRDVWTREHHEVPLDPPALERLDQVRAPALVLVGTRDVPDIQGIVERLERDVPDIERVDVKGAGHVLNLERPEVVERELRAFLTRVEAAISRDS